MTKISSTLTPFFKRVVPVLWFAFLVIWTSIMIGVGHSSGALVRNHALMLVAPAVMAAIGFIVMRRILWILVDEVFDCGDHLLVRNGGHERVIPLVEIEEVKESLMKKPPRVTIRLARRGSLGECVRFIPRRALHSFERNHVARDLERRIGEARVGM